ncbi:DUF3800 domain-containing protein [Dyadobacter sp. NIV53]|uniref:DUF3800 domain-containing protein n=1 Tax=Dyadobacter sp. NIV53 TaxID=2861765 RepID=UPI001C880065|nr:DUF3800 domain-containing protein [Dyadobacter sp. NIV53]
MYNQIAFLEQWGNNGMEFVKKGVSTHFVLTALILHKNHIQEAKRILKAIQNKHFQSGVIDSDLVANDHIKRKLILEDLLEVPFQIFALVVDKRQLVGEGLRYKGSFYKFIHGVADRELFKIFSNLEMVAGSFGTDTFMEGFIKYVSQNHISNLFNESTFGFVSDKEDMLIQASGFIAGTLARCYDETVMTDQRQDFVDILRLKLLTIKFWPDVFDSYLVKANTGLATFKRTLS